MELILASGSPRRRELLEQMNIVFETIPSTVEEKMDTTKSPAAIAMGLAEQKARDIFDKYSDRVVLGADTIVVSETKVLGKPTDQAEAIQMLRLLSGKTHEVITGVAILSKDHTEIFYEVSKVTFWQLSNKEIEWYVASGESMDKAGSYGIQKLGAYLVEKIEGDYFNIVGLPLAKTVRKLAKYGIELK